MRSLLRLATRRSMATPSNFLTRYNLRSKTWTRVAPPTGDVRPPTPFSSKTPGTNLRDVVAKLTPPVVTTTNDIARDLLTNTIISSSSGAHTPELQQNDVVNQTLTTPVTIKHHPAINPTSHVDDIIDVSVSPKILSSVNTTVLPISIGGKTSLYTSAGSDPMNTIVTQASSSSRQSPATGQRAERDQNRDVKSKKMNFSLKLDKFTGSNNENAKSWLSQFIQYGQCYELDDQTKANIFSFHLQDHAQIWYHSLPEDIKHNWEQLKANFLRRFTEGRNLIDFSILQTAQNNSESVLDFLSKLQKNAMLNDKIDENLLLAIGINGLKPDIRKIVINKEPKTFADLRHAASIAEKSLAVPINTLQSLQETMVTELQTLRDQINSIQASVQQNRHTEEPEKHINQMTFDDYSGREGNRPSQGQSRYQRNYSQSYQDHRAASRQPPTYNIQPLGRNPQVTGRNYNAQQQNYNNQYTRQNTENRQRPEPQAYCCNSCGDRACTNRRTCRARQAVCQFCKRTGHYTRLCLSARNSN